MVVEALAAANHVYQFEKIVGDLDKFCEVWWRGVRGE